MTKFIIAILLVGAAVGGYVAVTSRGERTDIGDPALSASPEATAAASASATFTDGTYRLIAASSSMQWEGRKTLIVNYIDRGSVNLSDGTATVKNGAIVSGSVVVDMKTISTSETGKGSGEDMQEKHIKGPDFFDVEKYPTAKFVFTSLTPASASGQYTVAGTLTIKDVTQPVSFPATVSASGDILTMKATATLDRTLWGIKYGSGKFFKDLGDKVIDDMFTVSFTAVGRLEK